MYIMENQNVNNYYNMPVEALINMNDEENLHGYITKKNLSENCR